MRGLLKAFGVTDRTVYAADSFCGLPPPNPQRYPADASDPHHTADVLAVSREDVEQNFRLYDLLDGQVCLLEGWFRDTLPRVRHHTWAVVRVDGDMYESTMDALENLYPGLSVGGYLIVDDFAHGPCRMAVEEFRTARNIDEPIEEIDWTGVFWRRRS
jgi:O-methyltransferase